VRYGGLLSNGPITGQVVVLGNVRGDFIAHGGLKGGRVAVKGSLLGNTVLEGGIDATAVLVAAGSIGSSAAGTGLTVGGVQGILAAKGDVLFTAPANTSGAAFFKADLGKSDPSALAIDALFTNAGKALAFDLSDLDLKGLGLILTDLAALQVSPGGVLTGPIP
jgi:hypothetical protein